MDDYVLILNAGSSSLKFCVFSRPQEEDWSLDCRGQIEGIGGAARLSARDAAGQKLIAHRVQGGVRDQREALDSVAEWLRARYGTHAKTRILGVGHRVVHGGAKYTAPIQVTDEVLKELHALTPLAPLHQLYNLAAIEAVSERMPGVPQVACFDTSFHRTMSAVAELVPLPREMRREGLQRYGFHGLSYEYIANALPRVAPEIADRRVIVAHLGSGASVCAMSGGKSVDCSLGFTALDGLCMGTRPGSLDPGVVLFLFQAKQMPAQEVQRMLYKKSGLLAISGSSNDMRDLLGSDEPDARLAVDYFVYRAAKEIGAMAAVLGGVDAIVFTAGMGEHSVEIRERICLASAWLGIDFDFQANARHSSQISRPGSTVSAWVVPTNEELMIARHTGLLLGLIAAHA